MKPPQWLRAGAAAAVVVPLVLVASAGPGGAAPDSSFTATALTPAEQIEVVKAPTSRLAQTDDSLLGLTGTAPTPILVKLDHDPLATYTGEVTGYAATSPAVTGDPLDGDSAERSYDGYLADREAEFTAALARAVPGAQVGQSLRTVYGGVAVTVPANRIDDVLAIDGVAAVQADALNQPVTDSSPAFIGADTLYPQLGGTADAGKGTTIGVIDTGAWPEHPSFADQGNLDPRPGPAPECSYGPDPTSGSPDPFECNNKLVGGADFLDTYHAVLGDEQFPFTARDDNGHGTHTMSTAAGNVLASAPVLGADHGPINGIAPGAWVVMYRACGPGGCFTSDTSAAVGQAVLDGVDAINYSISGGTNPFTDATELAFLDAYAAGVFVSASAGNAGPGAATVNHHSPWVTTVAASTQTREFASTLSLSADNGDTFESEGTSLTGGAGPAPIVMSSAPPYSNPLCDAPAAAGIFDGVIVACERGVIARVEKGFNVLQGGAEGMILFNPALADTASDNHWLPAVHLADGTDFVAFMSSHSGVTGSFTDGQKADGQGDVLAAFSSRGPGGLGLKPDITAPGVQILAGNIPIEGDPALGGGPAGEFFQAIQGTSMSAPHVAGSSLLIRALHPGWSPGQIKSALMTTALQGGVVKEDLTTPADPFDFGSGRVDLTVAGSAGLTLDETPANMVALGNDPVNAVHLNLPSINAPVMPGELSTTRTVTNVTNRAQVYRVEVDSPDDSRIRVSPRVFGVGPGMSRELRITITSSAPEQQLFGEIRLVPRRSSLPTQHLPVAFIHQQGEVSLSSSCLPESINWLGTSTCTVVATNHAFSEMTVDLATTTDLHLLVTGADGADKTGPFRVELADVTLAEAVPGNPSLAPGSNPAGGWLPLSLFTDPIPVGDEDLLNFNTPPFVYAGQIYTQMGVTSNGYLVAGPADSQDVEFDPPGIPNVAPPNNVLAPFWTDLDGGSAPGIRVVALTDGVNTWIVVEWELNPFGVVGDEQIFQTWLGINGVEDISFAYDPANLPASPHNLVVGAENVAGTDGDSLGFNVAPTEDQVVTSSDPIPGGSVSYDVHVRGIIPGTGTATSTMVGDRLPGTTVVTSEVEVRFRFF